MRKAAKRHVQRRIRPVSTFFGLFRCEGSIKIRHSGELSNGTASRAAFDRTDNMFGALEFSARWRAASSRCGLELAIDFGDQDPNAPQ